MPAASSSAFAHCSRAPAGGLTVDYADDAFRHLLGTELTQHLTTPAAADLLAALDAVLARVERDGTEVDIELSLIDPSGRDRRLCARVQGLSSGGETGAIVEIDVPRSAEIEAAGIAGSEPSHAAVVHVVRGKNGRLRLDFVDSAIRQLTGAEPEQLVDTPATAVILSRAEAVLAAASCPVGSMLCELSITDPGWGGRPLVCRFYRAGAGGGRSVGLLVYDPVPDRGAARAQARHTDALLRLLRLSEVLLEHPPQKEGLERIAEEIVGAAGIRNVAIGLLDRTGRRLHVAGRAHRGESAVAAAFSFGLGDGPCGTAISERRTIVDRPDDRESVCLYAPIEAAEEALGVLAMDVEPELEIDGWQEEIIGSYADYVAAFVAGAPARPRTLHRVAHSKPDGIDIAGRLTARQQEVLYLLVAAGASNRDIARSLSTTESTVKVHMRAILGGLRVGSRAGAIHLVYSRAAGWLAEMRRRSQS